MYNIGKRKNVQEEVEQVSLKSYCEENGRQYLLSEWDEKESSADT
jgi:hypothetical protein